MQRISGAQLKDIRSMKKHNTYGPISSQGQLRRPQPFTTLTNLDQKQQFLSDDMQQKQLKIKSLDQKLQSHKNQIQRNNDMITELVKNLDGLKVQLTQQQQITEGEERKCKQLRDEMERTNRLLRSKNGKIDELTKKLEHVEKDNQETKAAVARADELAKNLQAARRQSANLEKALEEINSEKKMVVKDKEQEIAGLREQLNAARARINDDQDTKKNLETKEKELMFLRSENSNLTIRIDKELQEKNALRTNYETIKRQLEILIENQKSHASKERERLDEKRQNQTLKEKLKAANIKIQQLKDLQSKVRHLQIQAAELRLKNATNCDLLQHTKSLHLKTLTQKDLQLSTLTSKVSTLSTLTQSLKSSLSTTTKSTQQLQLLKSKADHLTHLYSTLLPPLQCNLCHHNLDKPITVIPCGHNYCLSCKKGYTKACAVCGDKVRIQAVYRNQLLDDIAGMVRSIKEVIAMLK